jgi:hypothetical protein
MRAHGLVSLSPASDRLIARQEHDPRQVDVRRLIERALSV